MWAAAGTGCLITTEPSTSKRSGIKAGATASMKTKGDMGSLQSVIKSSLVQNKTGKKIKTASWDWVQYVKMYYVYNKILGSPFASGCFSGWLCFPFLSSPLSLAPPGHGAKKWGNYSTRCLLLGSFHLKAGVGREHGEASVIVEEPRSRVLPKSMGTASPAGLE